MSNYVGGSRRGLISENANGRIHDGMSVYCFSTFCLVCGSISLCAQYSTWRTRFRLTNSGSPQSFESEGNLLLLSGDGLVTDTIVLDHEEERRGSSSTPLIHSFSQRFRVEFKWQCLNVRLVGFRAHEPFD